jgi:hypothetical protein
MSAVSAVIKGLKWFKSNPVKGTAVLTGGAAVTSITAELALGEETIRPQNMGDVMNIQFPEDEASCGGMRTEIRFHSWKKGSGFAVQEGNQQTSSQKTDFLGIIRLPMPLQLATGYQGNYTEADNLVYDRDGALGGKLGAIDKLGGNLSGMLVEMKALVNSTANLTATSEMANASIDNNNMGMLYKGGSLRGHDFSWRLSAKSKEEQDIIQKVVIALKYLSSPANPGHLGGASDEDVAKLKERLSEVEGDPGALFKSASMQQLKAADQFLGGRLAIPPTCTVRFLVDNEENTHLFKVKDSFITNLTVNYTASSGWGAHQDGSPMEVQIGLTMKEIRTITRDDIRAGF